MSGSTRSSEGELVSPIKKRTRIELFTETMEHSRKLILLAEKQLAQLKERKSSVLAPAEIAALDKAIEALFKKFEKESDGCTPDQIDPYFMSYIVQCHTYIIAIFSDDSCAYSQPLDKITELFSTCLPETDTKDTLLMATANLVNQFSFLANHFERIHTDPLYYSSSFKSNELIGALAEFTTPYPAATAYLKGTFLKRSMGAIHVFYYSNVELFNAAAGLNEPTPPGKYSVTGGEKLKARDCIASFHNMLSVRDNYKAVLPELESISRCTPSPHFLEDPADYISDYLDTAKHQIAALTEDQIADLPHFLKALNHWEPYTPETCSKNIDFISMTMDHCATEALLHLSTAPEFRAQQALIRKTIEGLLEKMEDDKTFPKHKINPNQSAIDLLKRCLSNMEAAPALLATPARDLSADAGAGQAPVQDSVHEGTSEWALS